MSKSSLRSIIAYRLGAVKWVYLYKSLKLKQKLIKRPFNQNKPIEEGLIVANDEVCQNGGLCDCLHGIVSAYYIAKKENRPFYIRFSYPFQLTDYLFPNQIDWRIDPEEIDYRSCRILHVPMMLGRFHATWAEERAFHLKYLTHIARHRGPTLLFTNAHLLGELEFSQHFNELFRPSPALQEQIDFHLSLIGGPYLGASFRFRNLLGDFYEADSLPATPVKQESLIHRGIEQIELLHREEPLKKILVTSDSQKFCTSLSHLPYVYVLSGSRLNIATPDNASAMTSFLELMLLTRSIGNKLYVTDGLYRSNFTQTASFIGNLPYQEICF